MFPHLFSTCALGRHTLKNRAVLPAHGPRIAGARYLTYLEERLRGGVSMVVIGHPVSSSVTNYTVGPPAQWRNADLSERDTLWPNPVHGDGPEFYDERLHKHIQEEVELAHRYDVPCIAQMGHPGNFTIAENLQAGVSPSGVSDEMYGEQTHVLTQREIRDLIIAFGNAAARAQQSGMDGVEVHSAHGLLLNQFLSPITNLRTDAYGGSPVKRARLLYEVLEQVRARVGSDFVVGLRMPGDEYLEGGMTSEDAVATALRMQPHLDYVSISGASESGRKSGITIPAVPSAAVHGQAVYAEAARAMTSALSIPVILTGRVTDPVIADELVRDGACDLVGLVRATIADPEFVAKAQRGDLAGIRRCVGDNEGCRQRTLMRTRGGGMAIGCTVNAAAGREREMTIVPVAAARRVVVIGGGPGGMEAARVATLRGHDVTLLERADRLGGQILDACRDPRAQELSHAVHFLREQMTSLGVDVRLDTEASVQDVQALEPDAVIVATGARSGAPVGTVAAVDVLRGSAIPGKRVLVSAGLDGYRTPLLLALLLRARGHDVDLVTERAMIGESQDPATNHAMIKELLEAGVGMSAYTAATAVYGSEVTMTHSLTRRSWTVTADTVISVRREAEDTLLRALDPLAETGVEVLGIGDCLAPRRILFATLEGARASMAV